tara:strand:+ start:3898 stop:4167 length:270 start_codon:yes stop_codon:yes gene_type:complete
MKTKLKPKILIEDDGRTCIDCLEFKAWEEFHKQNTAATGHKPRCRTCHNETMQKSSKEIRDEEFKVNPLIVDFTLYRTHLKKRKTRKRT